MGEVDLADLLAAVSRYPDYSSGWGEEWAIVDELDQVRFATRDRDAAFTTFHAEVGKEPKDAHRLRLLHISSGFGCEELWPCRDTALERARRVHARYFSDHRLAESTDRRLREHFLRGRHGTLSIGMVDWQTIELTWPDRAGLWERVGLLVRCGQEPWSLLVDHNRRDAEPEMVEKRLAQVLNPFIPEVELNGDWIRARRYMSSPRRCSDVTGVLIDVLICTAEEFGLLDPEGDELS